MGPKKKVEEEAAAPVVVVEPSVTTGKGTFRFPDNTSYVGEWQEVDGTKRRHGRGSFTFLVSKTIAGCDEVYVGEWESDQMSGQGEYSFASGNKYRGTFKNNLFNGEGEYLFTDGASYIGEWKDNRWHGKGVYTDANQIKCEGEFFNGMYNSGRSYVSLRSS